MSTIREDVWELYPELIAIPAGTTAIITAVEGQIGIILKYVSGGSLSILTNPQSPRPGSTTVGTSFSIQTIYTMNTTEILNASVAGPLYLFATGSTCVANILRLRSHNS